MHSSQIERINASVGKRIDEIPIPLIYYDAQDGTVLKHNRRAEQVLMEATGLPGMPLTVYGDLGKLSSVAERMRRSEEFEFYVIYDHEQKRFVPISHLSGHDTDHVLVAQNFAASDHEGNFLSNCVMIRALSESQRELMFSDLESAKYATLTRAFGLTELTFYPSDLTMDARGGRDGYDFQRTPVEQVSKVIHPDDAEGFIDQFADASVQFPDHISFTTRVYSIKLKTYRYFRMIFYPQIDSLGNVLSYGGFCIDVNEEQMALKKKVEEVRQLMTQTTETTPDERSIISALANISHDLRNPIGIIMGVSDMLAQTVDPAKRAKYNDTIQASCKRLLDMVAEILNLNRIEFGNVEIHNHTFDLDALLRKVAEIHFLQFQSKGLNLVYESGCSPIRVNADELRLNEILDNYLSNALKYTDSGQATLRCDDLGDRVRIHVIDTGRGISKEGCEKVFNRFEKLDTKVKGNGLGLNICQGLAHAMGGKVGVSSTPGKGSDFWVEIPKGRIE